MQYITLTFLIGTLVLLKTFISFHKQYLCVVRIVSVLTLALHCKSKSTEMCISGKHDKTCNDVASQYIQTRSAKIGHVGT